jgi:hypothetical protein
MNRSSRAIYAVLSVRRSPPGWLYQQTRRLFVIKMFLFTARHLRRSLQIPHIKSIKQLKSTALNVLKIIKKLKTIKVIKFI